MPTMPPYIKLSALLALLALAGCTSLPPKNSDNICNLFDEKRGWYKDARRAERRWGTSIPVLMAIMYQESSLRPRAKPPRRKILWVLPGPRKSSRSEEHTSELQSRGHL